MKFIMWIVRWWNITFRGYKYTNVGDFTLEKKGQSKKQIVDQIVDVAGKLNGGLGVVPDGYREELRKKGKRLLVRTLMMLTRAHTLKMAGVRPRRKHPEIGMPPKENPKTIVMN